jgi:hypothetical protein
LQDQEAIETLIGKLTVIINKSWYSSSEQYSLIFSEFEAFFVQYSHLEVTVFSAEIEGFGVCQGFFDICNVYWRIENFDDAVGGPATPQGCKLLGQLNALWQDQSYSISERSDFKALFDKITVYYQGESDVKLRIKYFAEELYEFYILSEWSVSAIYSLEIEGYGSVYELIYAYIYVSLFGVREEMRVFAGTRMELSFFAKTRSEFAENRFTAWRDENSVLIEVIEFCYILLNILIAEITLVRTRGLHRINTNR